MRNVRRKLRKRLVRAQEHTRILIAAALVVAASGAVFGSEIQVSVSVPAGTIPASIVLVVDEISHSGDEAPQQYETSVEVPGLLDLDLEPGSVWRLAVASRHFWAAPKIISVGERPAMERLQVWPTARVVGEIEVERTEEVPAEIELRFESRPADEHKIARSSVACPVEGRRYECDLPATLLDLRLRARGFVSHYFWDVELSSKTQHEMVTSFLRRGGSIVGWVEIEDSSESFDAARVTLSREIASAIEDETASRRRAALGLEAKVNPRGFFELVGVPEGLYAVTVEHPAFAPGRASPIKVRAGAESELYHPIQLRKAVTLELAVRPPRPISARRWGIELLRLGESPGHLDQAADGLTSEGGTWKQAGLAPGDYVLRVSDGPEAAWYHESLSLPVGVETVSLQLDLPAEGLVGRVLVGSEPLAAELYFGAFHGAVRIAAQSDREGRFEVLVPMRESWTVDVYARDQQISQRFQDVIPEPGDSEGIRWLELVIPDTIVEGTVVDAQQRPVEGARVQASGRGGGQTQESDHEGAFVLRGLRPGEYGLSAASEDGRSRSAIRQIEINAEDPSPPVELVLTENRQIVGQVIGPSGSGVVGAKIVGLIEQSSQQMISFEVPEAVTDAAGSFSMEVPDLTEGVLLTTFAPGFAARQIRADSRSPEPVLIPVEPHGGTLRIRHGETVNRSMLRIFKTWLLPMHFSLTNWAQLHGELNETTGVYSVPMLEPGYYQVCPDPDYRFQLSGQLDLELAGNCSGGVLPPYGELELEIQ